MFATLSYFLILFAILGIFCNKYCNTLIFCNTKVLQYNTIGTTPGWSAHGYGGGVGKTRTAVGAM